MLHARETGKREQNTKYYECGMREKEKKRQPSQILKPKPSKKKRVSRKTSIGIACPLFNETGGNK
jgi:hypothetical protein